jgi:ribosome-associated protein
MVVRDFRRMAKSAAAAADDKKANHVVVLDVRKESDIADYLVIAGAESSAQMRAVSDAVIDRLHQNGARLTHREGHSHDRWIALDYGGLVVHILLAEARRFYRLDHLWEKARPIRWESP